jgi:hypothetical protein
MSVFMLQPEHLIDPIAAIKHQQGSGVGASAVDAPGSELLRAVSEGAILAGPPFAKGSLAFPWLPIVSETVLALKGSLRRAQHRRALDSCGPF